MEAFRLFVLGNQSLELLSLDICYFEGNTNGPPVNLPNLKSLSLHFFPDTVSKILHVPTIQHLSSLEVSLKGVPDVRLVGLIATGDWLTLLVKTALSHVIEVGPYSRRMTNHPLCSLLRLFGWPGFGF